MLPIQTILHPTDFSERSDAAFQLACALARDYGARLIVLHVATPPFVAVEAGVRVEVDEAQTQRLWDQLRQVRPSDPDLAVEHRLEEGRADAEILKAAVESRCDLIVLGTHGRTGLGRALLGSVAESVLRQARCPVFVIRSPSTEPEAMVGETTTRSTIVI